ncbi:MAG: hypothetical protein M3N34_10085, partial [Pseudomonadota bacterium]|nr:hypothetical protein [Pseudomonadota bacterium]
SHDAIVRTIQIPPDGGAGQGIFYAAMPPSRSLKFASTGRASRSAAMIAACAATIVVCAVSIAPLHAQDNLRQVRNNHAAMTIALIRLNRDPRDIEALITAGNAALAMGDTDAAVGFFTRADSLSPDNPRVEAGLASAKVHAEDPFGAIPLFIAAEKNGPIAPELLGDRGLAYDLIGDNATAQRYYHQALAGGVGSGSSADRGAGADTEISRRLGLSLAISGDRHGSETVLSALLQQKDRAAWRARIFALAILGYEEEAVATARSTMPSDLALQIAPYLRYMRRLTPAQQAAAANLGHFPQASQIGQDDPRIAQYARMLDRSRANGPDSSSGSGADQALVPAGAPLGRVARLPADQAGLDRPAGKRRKDSNHGDAVASAAPAPHFERASPGNAPPPALVVSRETQPPVASLLASAPPPVMQTPVIQTPVVQQLSLAPHDGHALAATPRPHGAETPARPSFSDAFAAMSPVMVDITPERGAVDLRRISPARAVPKPPPPSHPSRIWVELGVGRDTDRIAFDWRRMVKDDPELFRGKKPFVSSLARTNRLLVGPFDTDKSANAFTEKLHKADHPSAFVWTSPAGQVVDPLE